MSGAITFERAGAAQEHEVRAILRDVPLGGDWSIALTREPDGLGGLHLPGERQDFILARESATGAAVGLCERVVRPAYVGGKVVELPYLGALRIVPSHRHRIAILKGGFGALREGSERDSDHGAALTSITSDNTAARRLLTAGLKGLPRYAPLCDFATLALRPRAAAPDPDIAGADDHENLAAFLAPIMVGRDCAPVWSAAALRALAAQAQMLVLRESGAITGCAALWDQRAVRQAVLVGAPGWLQALRAPANLAFRTLGLPALPRIGAAIDQAFLSICAVAGDCAARFLRLVRAGLAQAHALGLGAVMVGLPAMHPWRKALRARYRVIEYRTSLFAVTWPDRPAAIPEIDPARVFPEIGLL